MLLMIEDRGREPVEKRLFIGSMKLSDLGEFTDLRPMRLKGSPFPDILGEESSINSDLGSEKLDHIRGDLRLGSGKTAFVV